MDYTAANEAADAARLAIAAQQLVTASRPDRHLCSGVLADTWSSAAPRCPEPAAFYVCRDDYGTGMATMGEFEPAAGYTRLCAGHEEQVRREPGWRWSQPLSA